MLRPPLAFGRSSGNWQCLQQVQQGVQVIYIVKFQLQTALFSASGNAHLPPQTTGERFFHFSDVDAVLIRGLFLFFFWLQSKFFCRGLRLPDRQALIRNELGKGGLGLFPPLP